MPYKQRKTCEICQKENLANLSSHMIQVHGKMMGRRKRSSTQNISSGKSTHHAEELQHFGTMTNQNKKTAVVNKTDEEFIALLREILYNVLKEKFSI